MAVLMPEGRQSFENSAGEPLVGGKLYTYAAGTSTPKATFVDAAGLTPNTNPIILDARGECVVFWSGAYKVTLTDANDVLIYTQDNIVSGDSSIAGLQQQVDDLEQQVADTVIWTSDYNAFADAVSAATNRHLMINTPVTVGADMDIAASTSIEVVKPGLITLNAGQTLTIRGSFDAGEFQVFTGPGTVKFHSSSRSVSPAIWFSPTSVGAVFNTRRLLLQNAGEPGGPVHAFEDQNTLDFTYPMAANFNAYAAYDCETQITGAGAYDHHVSFQSRPTYSGSGSIWSRWDGFNWLPTHSGTGTVAAMRGVHIENPLGSGVINFLAGIMIQRLNRGGETWGIYSATGANTISVGAGEGASWLLRGNGLTGGFGLNIQSAADSSARILQTANFPLRFGTNNVDTGVCTADGRWKLASTGTTDILTANQRLEVAGAGGATFKATGGAGTGCSLQWNNAAAGDNLFEGFYTDVAPTLRGSIDFNRAGTLTRYNTTSDATLKTRLGDADVGKAVDRLMRVKLHQFAWKEDPTQRSQLGPFAQELHAVMEGAVSVGGEYEEEVDGQIVKKYRPWGVDKTAFVWHLVAGFQQQQRDIESLMQRVADLERGV